MRVQIDKACQLLKTGHVVSIPTETVYGLAAALNQQDAIDEIFKLKKRPANNPLIIHLPSAESVHDYALKIPSDFAKLAKAFWPGPLTMVLQVDPSKISEQVRAGLPTAAFRIPNHEIALKVIKKVGPIVMPSANLSGKPSATKAEHVENDFGKNFPVLDGGSCERGIESTIITFVDEKWQIVRLGSLTAEDLEVVLGYRPKVAVLQKGEQPLCPGQLFRHYAPKANLVLTDSAEKCSGTVLGYRDRKYANAKRIFILGSVEVPEEVAENLYAVLRQLDEENIASAHVDVKVPQDGLWRTILERIAKASNKK